MLVGLSYIIMPLPAISMETASECERQVRAFVALEDYSAAIEKAYQYLEKYPDHQGLRIALLKAMACEGSYEQWLSFFDNSFPFFEGKNDLLPWIDLCRAHLLKNMKEGTEHLRLITVLAGAFIKDPIFGHVLRIGMQDPSIKVRKLSVSVAAVYGGGSPEQLAIMAASKDSSEKVRMEAYRFLAQRGVRDAADMLFQVACSSSFGRTERNVARAAFVTLKDGFTYSEAVAGLNSSDMQRRLMTCELLEKFQASYTVPLLIQALNDSLTDVTMSAIEALLRMDQENLWNYHQELKNVLMDLSTKSSHFSVKAGISALLVKNGFSEGRDLLLKGLHSSCWKEKDTFAAILKMCGPVGIDLALQEWKKSDDPHYKAQLALTLFLRRESVEEALIILENYVHSYGLIANVFEDRGVVFNLFQNETEVAHSLKLIKLLVVNQVNSTQSIVEALLMKMDKYEQQIDTLFSENPSFGLNKILQKIFSENEGELKLKAAVALAIWCRNSSVSSYLTESYAVAGYHDRARILQAFIALGLSNPETLAFCKNACREPQPILRTLAMSALLNGV